MAEKVNRTPLFECDFIHTASQLFEAELEQDSIEDTEISEENAENTIWGQIYSKSKRYELWSELS